MGEAAPQRVVILGAGRVATHLVPALVKVGVEVLHVWSRTEVAARHLAEPLGLPYTADLEAVATDADAYIVCVTDGALPEVAARIAGRVSREALFLHTAGSIDMELWRHCGAEHYGILYPLQTFSKEREVDMREVSLFVEASDEVALARVEALARGLSGKVYRADSKLRARLHIAAVFACNFTNAMYVVAHHLLKEDGIPFDVLLPLIDETASKVHTLAPRDAQTGPAVRGDEAVMQSHLDALTGDEELREIYAKISNYIKKRNK